MSRSRIALLIFIAGTLTGVYFAMQAYWNPAIVPPLTWSQALSAYDSARVLADAIRRAPTLDRRAIRDALAATRDFHGVTGTITFGADRNPIGKKVVIEKVQGGKLLLQKTITPSPSRQPQDAPA